MTVDKRIRVLHTGLTDGRGGIESFLYNMFCNVDWHRFKFDFLCYGAQSAFDEELANMGAALIELPDRRSLSAYAGTLRRVLSQGYDVFHMHKNSPIDFVFAMVAKKCSAKIIVHAHNTEANVSDRHAVLMRLGRSVFKKDAGLMFACSTPAGEWVFGKEAGFEFFPNAIKLGCFAFDSSARARLRDDLDIQQDAFVIGSVGRLVEQKNYPFLMHRFSLLHSEFPSARLVVAGDGELRETLQQHASEHGVSDSALFLGARSDVAQLDSASDWLYAFSLWEGFSFVTLEAQAGGALLCQPRRPGRGTSDRSCATVRFGRTTLGWVDRGIGGISASTVCGRRLRVRGPEGLRSLRRRREAHGYLQAAARQGRS